MEQMLAPSSPLRHLVESYLLEERRRLLERFPSCSTHDDFLRVQAQVAFIDLLVPGLRDSLKVYFLENEDKPT